MMSDRQKDKFAARFLRGRVRGFLKDVEICLTPDAKGTQADFPALFTCIAFADLMSGLHAGKLDFHGLKELQRYTECFMDRAHYTPDLITVLYEMFRHKLAHLGHPYMVFDTGPKQKIPGTRKRIAWTVDDSKRTPPIELVPCSGQTLKRTKTPWPVPYDHSIHVSVRSLADDLARSVIGPTGYLRFVQSDAEARTKFWRCMEAFYPR